MFIRIFSHSYIYLHIYGRRQQVANELQILYKNLTDLKVTATHDRSLCRDSLDTNNVLGFYNAFIDYSSGLVNLVVEYMDSGSLEDLVQDGGCSDERVLVSVCEWYKQATDRQATADSQPVCLYF